MRTTQTRFTPIHLASAFRTPLGTLVGVASDRGLSVRFTPAVARWVAEKGFRPETGARELRRVIAQHVEPGLSDLLLDGAPSGEVVVRVSRGALCFDRA